MTTANDCLPIDSLATGNHPPAVKAGDFLIVDPWGSPIHVREEDEIDDTGATIGTPRGISVHRPFYIVHRRLFEAFAIEYLVWQNGPINVEFHDTTGYYQGHVLGAYEPPQGKRRYMAVYYPKGVGSFGLFGPPSGVAEGLILKICALGRSSGGNPAFPKDLSAGKAGTVIKLRHIGRRT